ncbi:MAG: FtsX-like permease family protein, partial [Clostridiales bacterium]|nr:FtsX-like permease family protein [Clostridiales bacterium]
MKKLSFNRLAFLDLKRNFKQYLTMIISIILAMTFSSSVIFVGYGFYSVLVQTKQLDFCNCDFICENPNLDGMKELADNGAIKNNYGYAHIVGYMFTDDNNELDGNYVAWLDDNAIKLANPVLVKGEYPTKENEIALESAVLAKLGIVADIGDTIKIKFCDQNSTSYKEEPYEREFVLTGILRNKKNNLSYYIPFNDKVVPSAFVAQGTNAFEKSQEKLIGFFDADYFKLYNYIKYDDGKFFSYYSDIYVFDIPYHSNLNFTDVLLFSSIVIVAFMLASCVAVANTFNSNIGQKKKQIGFFRAVGATKRQIRKIYLRENFIISLICIVLPLVISYLIALALVKSFGSEYVFHLNIWILLLCIIFSVAVIAISSSIPLISASRISPMQAIRNIENDHNMKAKHIKTQKSFDVPSLIAKRSLIFSKGKQFVVALFVMLAMLSSCYVGMILTYGKVDYSDFHFLDYEMTFHSQGESVSSINYDSENDGYTESMKQRVLQTNYIGDFIGFKSAKAVLYIDEFTDYFNFNSGYYVYDIFDRQGKSADKYNYNEALFSKFSEDYLELKNKLNSKDFVTVGLKSMNADKFNILKDFVVEGEINVDKIKSGEEIILVSPRKAGAIYSGSLSYVTGDILKNNENNCIAIYECPYHAGDKIDISILQQSRPNKDKEINRTD